MPEYVATHRDPTVKPYTFTLPDGVEPSPELERAGWSVELAPEQVEDDERPVTDLDLGTPETPSEDGEQATDPLNPTKEK